MPTKAVVLSPVSHLHLGHISWPAAVDRWGSVVSAKIPISVVIGQKIHNKSFPKGHRPETVPTPADYRTASVHKGGRRGSG